MHIYFLLFFLPLFPLCAFNITEKKPLSISYEEQYVETRKTHPEEPEERRAQLSKLTTPQEINTAVINIALNNCCNKQRQEIVKKSIEDALAIEKKNTQENRVTFYHGRANEFKILDVLNKVVGKQAPFLGSPIKRTNPNETALERFNKIKIDHAKLSPAERKESKPGLIDTSSLVSKRLISAVLTPFSNLLTSFQVKAAKTISALYFFTQGTSFLTLDDILTQVFKENGIKNPKKAFDEISDIFKKYKTPEGQLILISIPIDIVDKYAYLSAVGGNPATVYVKKNNQFKILPLSVVLKEFFDEERKVFNIEDYQVRIVDLDLDQAYKEGIKIDILSTGTTEQEQQLEAELTKYFEQLFAQQKTEIPPKIVQKKASWANRIFKKSKATINRTIAKYRKKQPQESV